MVRPGQADRHKPPAAIGHQWTCHNKGRALHVCYSPAPREKNLMSAAYSGKFSKTDFRKTGFAASGPEPNAGEVEGS